MKYYKTTGWVFNIWCHDGQHWYYYHPLKNIWNVVVLSPTECDPTDPPKEITKEEVFIELL